MTIAAIRGFNDILPDEARVWRRIEEEAAAVFSGYGFSEIKPPIVERTELFARSIGETTDIVEKEMYTFTDRGGDSLTLRPEGTASVVRAYIEHKMYQSPVVKLYYAGPMFRYERPQKGRYRQFYQIGAEVLGDASPQADAEVIEMLVRLFGRINLKGVELQINSLGCGICRPAYKDRLKSFLESKKDKLCANCLRREAANPFRALDCKNPSCVEATAGAAPIADFLCESCAGHFDIVKKRLASGGVEARINPRIVRGLDYYSKTTFEITAVGLGAQNAVAAGGRYDTLVEELGGPATPCIGFAIGVERVALLVKEGGIPEPTRPLCVFIAIGGEAEEKGRGLVASWREKGVAIIEEFGQGQMKGRMKKADKMGAGYVIILGTDELKEGVVTLKDMKTAAQEKVPFDAVAKRVGV